MEDRKKDVDIKTIFDFLRITPLFSMVLGFFFTSFYFIHIGYFPQNDINSLISTLIYVTISSFIVLGIIPFLSYLAILLWVRNTYADPKISQWLLKRDQIEPACLISLHGKTNDLIQTKDITQKILKNYLLSMAIAVPIILFILFTQTILSLSILIVIITGLTILVAALTIIYSPEFIWDLSPKTHESIKTYISNIDITKTKKQRYIFLLKYLTNSIASSLILSLVITLLLLISHDYGLPYTIFISLIVMSLSAAWFNYVTENDSRPKAHVTFFALYIVTILLLTQGNLIKSTLSHSKLGAFKASIFVDYNTCSMFNKLGKNTNCAKKGLTQISDLNIKWRGADQYITFEADTPSNTCPTTCDCTKTKKDKLQNLTSTQHYLIIPSSEIHGMSDN